MPKKINPLSLSSQGLKYKLKISFYLMSILPLLVCIYLVSNYILPYFGLRLEITATVIASIFIAVIGFFVVKEVFDRIVSVSAVAKRIAAGDVDRIIELEEGDEVGDLGDALNQMTSRIRSNMDELKSYSEKTTEINLEIQKRVIMLSSLLQISSLISQGAKLEDILKVSTEKSRLLANSDAAYLLFREEGKENFYMKVADGQNLEQLLKINIAQKEDFFNRAFNINKPFVLDKQNKLNKELSDAFYEKFGLKTSLAIPVFLRGRIAAVLGIGSIAELMVYGKEDIELLEIFSKQVSIAIENDILVHRIDKLEIKDVLTGLYNAAFIRSRLQEEIKRAIAYQRPCAFVVFDIDKLNDFYQRFGSLQVEITLKKISSLIRDSVTEIDRVGRIGDDKFAIILPEKNKRQAHEVAESIRRKIEFSFGEEQDPAKKVTVSGGVSENPLDGIEAEELVAKAEKALMAAKEKGRNCVVSLDVSNRVCR